MQSIEDIYIDDDFGCMNLAANMRLLQSSDSLDNINFDMISKHIFNQTAGSILAANTSIQTDLKAIEPAKITEIHDDSD